MNNADDDTVLFQVQTQQLAHHVQRRLACVVAVVSAAFLLMAQGDAAGFAGYQDYFGALGEVPRGEEAVYYEGWRDCGCCCLFSLVISL